jgi:pyridoxamine 5'-phosphate oxidase
MNLEQFRRDYLQGGLRRNDLPNDPFALFASWQQQAIQSGLLDPTAMVVASVDAAGQPSQRIVLLKNVDEQGFVFYTNYASRKAQEIAANAKVALLFPWHVMERQVRVSGEATKVDAAESAHYFAVRPRESQLAAWASPQSTTIESRQVLLDKLAEVRGQFGDAEVPLPPLWGGYRVIPHEIEFWQGGGNRLHDRFCYRRQPDGNWLIVRLAP